MSMITSIWTQDFFSWGLHQITEKNIVLKNLTILGRDPFAQEPEQCHFSHRPWITSERRKQLPYLMELPTNYAPSGTVPQAQLDAQQPRRRRPSTHLQLWNVTHKLSVPSICSLPIDWAKWKRGRFNYKRGGNVTISGFLNYLCVGITYLFYFYGYINPFNPLEYRLVYFHLD